MTQADITRNDLAFLQYMRGLAEQIEREEEAYGEQLNEWINRAANGSGQTVQVPIVPLLLHKMMPRIERRDIEVMLAWARGENVLLHVLERE